MTRCDLPTVQCRLCRVTVKGADIDVPNRCLDRRCPLNAMAREAASAKSAAAAAERNQSAPPAAAGGQA